MSNAGKFAEIFCSAPALVAPAMCNVSLWILPNAAIFEAISTAMYAL